LPASVLRMFVVCLCLVCASFVFAAPELRPEQWARPVIDTRVGNLYQVSPGVFRAEQPSRSDIPDLQALGIKTLLNLREYHEDGAHFARAGFRLERHPMAAGSVANDDLVAALRLIHKSPKPVLVHCWHGSDRTGFVIAGYRLVFEGWSKQAAIDELRRGGFGYHERTYPNIKRALEALDVEALRRAVLDQEQPARDQGASSRRSVS
jgi:tyrosine-protein phosphatase SIW14